MEFWCFNILSNKVDTKDPSGCVAVYGTKLFSGLNLSHCQKITLAQFPEATFRENCGWIFEGEESKLCDLDFKYLIEHTERLRNSNSGTIE